MKSHSARTLQVTYKNLHPALLIKCLLLWAGQELRGSPPPPVGHPPSVGFRSSTQTLSSLLPLGGRVRGLELPRPCARRRAKRLLARSGAGEKTHLLSVRHGTEAEGRMRQCAPGRAGPAEAASDWGQIRDASQRDRGRVCREWVGF